ncbi:MAG: circularly permuted type 2 ATP-grasp protein, partial [Pseudomonadota bacterium]|nr:circularly permuted type 2 ATP-grasp protein [Pseudomonadota bacterium]
MLSSAETEPIRDRLAALSLPELKQRAAAAEAELLNLGITFTVYSEPSAEAIDRILPFDVIPRVLSASDWRQIESGVEQRVTAINLLLQDVYHGQKILKDGVLPADLVLGNTNYRPIMQGLDLPHGTYVHVSGTDIIRDDQGTFQVLEDNVRTPSGVSYVVENRHMMLRAFPDLLHDIALRSIDNYGMHLLDAMREIAPRGVADPRVVLLSPGIYNSAFFEHVFLAREMGAQLVEGRDLTVENDRVYMRTTSGLSPVHVIYRRIDDDALDPEVFRSDSMLGVPGLMRAYRAGNVALANAVGTGIADD